MHRLLDAMRSDAFVAVKDLLLWRQAVLQELAENAFAEAGIPCLMYGPGPSIGKGNFSMRVEDLVQAARLYALIALHVTSQPRAQRPRAGAVDGRPVS